MPTNSSRSARKVGGSLAKHATLIVVSVLLGFPLLWMVLTSLKSDPQSLAIPPVWLPHPFLWSNYPDMLSAVPFWRFI
ncbi:MAG: carbohydrate ABC transporter permease, partial [Acidimicrobiales bacterium]